MTVPAGSGVDVRYGWANEVDAAHPLPDGFGNTASGVVFSGTCTITGS